MLLEEEYDILEIASRFALSTIKFEKVQESSRTFLTRYEQERKLFLLRNLSKMDDIKMSYLYFECFNNREENRKTSELRLKKEINCNNDRVCSISYNFLKLIYANN
jgi:hypothetical protein